MKEQAGNVPIMCLIRCRSGNFEYSEGEIQVMKDDIETLRENGADGFVIGECREVGRGIGSRGPNVVRTMGAESCRKLRVLNERNQSTGALDSSGEIYVDQCSILRAACGSLPVTFHRYSIF